MIKNKSFEVQTQDRIRTRFRRVPWYTRSWVFALTGSAIIAIGSWFGPTDYPLVHAILLNLGLVIVAVVVLDMLWRLAGGNPTEEQIANLSSQIERLAQTMDVIEQSKKIRLRTVSDCAANYGTKDDWLNLLQNATSQVDILGRTLFGWAQVKESVIEILISKVINEGVVFRWLVMSDKNQYLLLLEKHNIVPGEILSKKLEPIYTILREVRKRLPENCREKVQVRLFHDTALYCSLHHIDDLYLVNPYLVSSDARNCPLLVFEGPDSPWADVFNLEFEAIWERSLPLPDDPVDNDIKAI